MSDIHGADIEFKRLEAEMEKDAHLLDEKKARLKHIVDETEAFRIENAKQKNEMKLREEKMTKNEREKSKLEGEIHQMQARQQQQHMNLQRMTNTIKERLSGHGVKPGVN
jgi:chromosome segregation ATPase